MAIKTDTGIPTKIPPRKLVRRDFISKYQFTFATSALWSRPISLYTYTDSK